jgi:hypothetical protein
LFTFSFFSLLPLSGWETHLSRSKASIVSRIAEIISKKKAKTDCDFYPSSSLSFSLSYDRFLWHLLYLLSNGILRLTQREGLSWLKENSSLVTLSFLSFSFPFLSLPLPSSYLSFKPSSFSYRTSPLSRSHLEFQQKYTQREREMEVLSVLAISAVISTVVYFVMRMRANAVKGVPLPLPPLPVDDKAIALQLDFAGKKEGG